MGSVLSYSSIALVGAGILALLLALGSRSLLMGIPRDSGARGLALASGLLSILGVAACAVLFFLVLRQNSPLGEADVPGWLLLLSALVGLAAQITYLLCLRRIALRFFNADLAGRIVALLLFTVLAVGLAIGAMHVGKCIHPPGGATALTAVVAGPAVSKLGYSFVVRPVLLNAVTIVVVAVAFNALFAWRRYPAHLVRRCRPPVGDDVSHEQILTALRSLDSFVDITEDDLLRLHHLFTTGGLTDE